MKSLFKNLPPAAIAVSLFLCQGCTSTELVEIPGEQPAKPDVISISLSAPHLETRADATHRLRYTARLFSGNTETGHIEFIKKKQMLEGESSTVLVFDGVEEGTYTITLFADYVPANSEPDDNGEYPDYYYDTSGYEDIVMKDAGKEFLNNDHYDCFGKYIIVKKEAEEKRETVALPRIVAKVRMIGNETSSGETPTAVSVTKFSTLLSYKLTSGRASEIYRYPTGEVPGNKWDLTPSLTAPNELFYFYTFAASPSLNNGKAQTLGYLSFSVEADGLDPVNTDINSGEIQVRPNYVSTVKGNFIPSTPDDPDTRTDRIILDLSSIAGWNND